MCGTPADFKHVCRTVTLSIPMIAMYARCSDQRRPVVIHDRRKAASNRSMEMYNGLMSYRFPAHKTFATQPNQVAGTAYVARS
jgi:hypothetical protein